MLGLVRTSHPSREETRQYDVTTLRRGADGKRPHAGDPEPVRRSPSPLGTPPTTPPSAAKAAIKAQVLAASIGAEKSARLDGRYELVREIGRGSVGVLWEARQEPLGRPVAIKFLRGRAKTQHGRVLREAQAIASLDHRHIVKVFDFGEDAEGSPYIVMELLRGPSLASYIASFAPAPSVTVRAIALEICDALASAHELGLIHRDVKPANILAAQGGGGELVWKLVDFGLCKRAEGLHLPEITATGTPIGTPGYMAPEQFRSEPVDARSDVYALGCVIFELLTGRPAFPGRNATERVLAQLRSEINRDAPRIPAIWQPIVRKSVALNPRERFPTIGALARAIQESIPGPPQPRTGRMHPALAFMLGMGTTLAGLAAYHFAG